MLAEMYRRVTSLSIGVKLALLMFFSHIETNLNSTYSHLAEQLKQKAEKQDVCIKDNTRKDIKRNQLNLPPMHKFFKYYRVISTAYHSLNLAKYLVLLLSMYAKILPIGLNCYLPGRISLNVYILDLSPLIGLYLLVMVVAWRISVKACRGFELDLVLFLLHDKELVEAESLDMGNMNRKSTYSSSQPEADSFQNLLQRVLFYSVHHGNVVLYRKRPNRTEWARKEMIKLLDRLLYLPVVLFFFEALAMPAVLHASSTDMNFIKLYPTCCSQLEAQMPKSQWQIDFNYCWIRLLTIPIDFMDNFVLNTELCFTLGPPTIIGILVTRDLLLQWGAIKPKIQRLAERLRQQQGHHFLFDNSTTLLIEPQDALNNKKLDLDFYMKGFGELGVDYEADTNELFSLLCDFFESLGRANQFVGFYLSYLVASFFAAIILLGYTTYLIPNYWQSIVLIIFCFILYASFLSASTAVLRLKSFLDGSYVDICTIMAMDKLAPRKRKWMLILDNYTQRARNTYSLVTGTRFTWAFVLNCLATSISFLAAVETYKSYWKEQA